MFEPTSRPTASGPRLRAILCGLVSSAAALGGFPALLRAQQVVEFNRDIRPILSDNCFQCHGPDAAQRKADLRLDVESDAWREREGRRPIVPGQVDQSELVRRITSLEPDQHMPPLDSGKKLTAAQIDLIVRWIDAGAAWQPHWAFLPPQCPPLPPVGNPAWLRNPIDAFVLARLDAEGLTPAPEADKTTLLRRVTLDLTGLPPSPAEVEAFVADHSADAYERIVDRLLASPRYGERMAARWLDAARYADTSGYQTDGVRYMWRWRDWVIEAFNRNLPFDQFTIEQLAGDMLPDATLEQRIATGFNRNHRGNSEGGIIPEEYAVEYVVDRVETTATVWLGLTVGCARCHDHKFDPITQAEFYRAFALFNNVPEKGRAIKVGNSPPMINAPTHVQQQQLQALDDRLADARTRLHELEGEISAAEAQWIASHPAQILTQWAPTESLAAHFPLDGSVDNVRAASTANAGPAATGGTASYDAGMVASAAVLDGTAPISVGDVGRFGYFDRFTLAAWIFPRNENGTILARMAPVADADGYAVQLASGKLQVNLVKRWLDDAVRVQTAEPLASDRWQHVAVTYDGSRAAGGIQVFIDGQPQKMEILLDELNQSFSNDEPLRIGGGGPGPNFQGRIDDVRIYEASLSANEVALLATPESIDAILAHPACERTPRQVAKLRAYFLDEQAPQPVRDARRRIRELESERSKLEDSLPTTMVMQEMPSPRETFVLARGQYDKPLGTVAPGLPASLNAAGREVRNRLELARWLVDRANPLVARVGVNRFWQSCFGAGLVKTVDDFGAQGEPPTHRELLDWLAVQWMDSGWDMKAIQRTIVTSATYRQSSAFTSDTAHRDPENRLLARGPRFRLPAEVIRDSALAAGGVLVEQFGGPSVQPYQPAGLWKELTGGGEYVQDRGANLYRRSLYTFWKRTIAPPSLITFDAAAREACTVRASRTNTPLQALALLNEVTFVEAARRLAERVMTAEANDPAARLARMVLAVLGRRPQPRELEVLRAGFARQLAAFRQDPAAAEKLLAVGEAVRNPRLDACALAAYATSASLIMNLDEAVTKE